MKRLKKIVFFFFKIFFFCVFGVFLLVLFLFFYFAKDLPRPEIFFERELPQSTKIYDRTGQILLYEIFGEERRTFVSLEKIPDYLRKAVIAVEDANFYKHFGVEPKAILRAILTDLRIKKPIYGASTIPQQLIRSTFLSLEKTPQRKIREIILAIELDRRYSKDQILEWYLNQVPFGQNAYGVEAASQTYFGKSVSELTLAEAATLAALIKAPAKLSPYDEQGKKELMKRKNYVLERMVEEGFITKQQAEEAKKEVLNFKEKKIEILAPYFTLWVKEILEEKYGKEFVATKGLKVYTTLDFKLQEIAERVVREGIKRNKAFNAHNAALVAIDPKTGEILAMTVGTGNYFEDPYPPGCTPGKDCLFDPRFNVAIAKPGRQPGSAFKPFVYVTAFEKGYDDKTIVVDEPTNFGIWGGKPYIPQNYDGKFRGPITLREALAQSLNVPSVKVLLYLAGLEDSIKTAQKLGISTLTPPFGPSIVLGGWEVTLLEMTAAYSVFANSGIKTNISPILKIIDSEGNVIFEHKKNGIRVLDSKAVELLNDVLSDNEARAPVFGLNSPLYFEGRKVAAKTGTTQNFRDCWTIGYTPEIAVGVWAGNNNNAPVKRKPGVAIAGPIFHQFLEEFFKLKSL